MNNCQGSYMTWKVMEFDMLIMEKIEAFIVMEFDPLFDLVMESHGNL
jgi:hypothetical protein